MGCGNGRRTRPALVSGAASPYPVAMNPALLFLLLVLGLPTLELYVLIQMGSLVGAVPALLLVVLTAIVGTFLVRHQGLGTLLRVREVMARGGVPALEILEGALLLLGGLLLLIPGFLTDLLGFLCLVPPLRRWLVLAVLDRYRTGAGMTPAPGNSGGSGPAGPGSVIEGEFRRERDSR
jgi:UPF0716 protein FxsA